MTRVVRFCVVAAALIAVGVGRVPVQTSIRSLGVTSVFAAAADDPGDPRPSCKFAGALCGYVDQAGKTVIEPQFEWADRFVEDRAIVIKNRLYGAIDKTGNYVIRPRYRLMSAFAQGLAQVLRGDQLGVVDRDGRLVLRPEHGRIVRISQDRFLVVLPPYTESRGRGFERLEPLNDRLSRTHPYAYGKRWGVVSRGGFWIVRPTYPRVNAFSDDLNGLFWAADSVGSRPRWRLMRADGSPVSEESFDHVQQIQPGQDRAVVQRGGRWGAIDGTGKIAVDLKFDWLSYFRDGWAMYKLAGKQGRIDRDGKVLAEGPIQPSISDRDTKLSAMVDGKPLFTNAAKTVLLGTDHPKCPDGRHLQFENGSWKIAGADARPLWDMAFEYVHLVCSGHSLVQKDGRWGFLTADGRILAGKYFDRAKKFDGGIAMVGEGGLWSVIDEDGQTLLGPLKLARGTSVSGIGEFSIELEQGYVRLDKARVAELARDPEALTRPLPPKLPMSEGVSASYDPATGKWGYIDATGQFLIKPRFDAAGSFSRGVAWAAFPERKEWCLIDKSGGIRSNRSCQCQQPLVIVELSSAPAGGPCYEAGLAIVRGVPVIRGTAP